MNNDVYKYNDFTHPKSQIKEVEKTEMSKPANEKPHVSKYQLAEVVVYGFKRDGDSYENDYTNVARLFYGYVEKIGKQECVYIEGAGTEDNLPDDDAAVATGAFLSSIRRKARKACDKVIIKLDPYRKGKGSDIDTLTFDVFGFSRGSATARYFTHFVTCTDTKKEVPDKIKYPIPAEDFKDEDYWKTGDFYYETGAKEGYGISATINAGKSIFWKRTKTRLLSDAIIKK